MVVEAGTGPKEVHFKLSPTKNRILLQKNKTNFERIKNNVQFQKFYVYGRADGNVVSHFGYV